jgi:hypothetical protein
MKLREKQTDTEEIIVRHIKLTRGPVVALSCVLVVLALLVYLTLTGERVAASEAETAQASSTGMRQFYLTKLGHMAYAATTACAEGYHMASLWELADPTNLKYNVALGLGASGGDLGQGPPATHGDISGWVRTGYAANSGTIPGKANCDGWESTTGYGSTAYLHYDWTSGMEDVGVWSVDIKTCQYDWFVWCIED